MLIKHHQKMRRKKRLFLWTLLTILLTCKITTASASASTLAEEVPLVENRLNELSFNIDKSSYIISEFYNDKDEEENEIEWNGNWAHGCNFKGNDLFKLVNISGEFCGPQCDRTPDCTHYTWTKEENGTCWLKHGAIAKSNATRADNWFYVCGLSDFGLKWRICGMENELMAERRKRDDGNVDVGESGDEDEDEKRVYRICDMSRIKWHESNYAYGCDFPGNDVASVRVSGEQCGTMCDRKRECTHYTWTTYEDGTCWLKSGAVFKKDAVKTHDLTMTCGFTNLPYKLANCRKKAEMESSRLNEDKSVPNNVCNYTEILWTKYNYALGCDFSGNDFSSKKCSVENCAVMCHNTPGCSHYTWSLDNGGTCYMKKGHVTKQNASLTSDLSTVCGFVDFFKMAETCATNRGVSMIYELKAYDPTSVCKKIEIFLQPEHVRFPKSIVIMSDVCESIIQKNFIYGVKYLYYFPTIMKFLKLFIRF